jgi:hypothetical protein
MVFGDSSDDAEDVPLMRRAFGDSSDEEVFWIRQVAHGPIGGTSQLETRHCNPTCRHFASTFFCWHLDRDCIVIAIQVRSGEDTLQPWAVRTPWARDIQTTM